MNKLPDYVIGNPYFGKAELGSVDELEEPETGYCCDELKALVEYSNGIFEMAETPEEYEEQLRKFEEMEY